MKVSYNFAIALLLNYYFVFCKLQLAKGGRGVIDSAKMSLICVSKNVLEF